MALYIVIKENKYYPKLTYLSRDDDGFQKCILKRAPNNAPGWIIDKTFGAVVPAVPELIEAIAEVHPGGGVDPKVLKRLMGN